MDSTERLSQRLAVLERRVRLVGALSLVLGATLLFGAFRQPSDVVRARGLVITDAAGRERIVLGAPMANASRDAKLAEAVGLAVLDSLGRMHVAVGANNPLVLPGGETGARVGMSAGLTIYDPRNGGERGGMAAFADGRTNACLDYGGASKEAICMIVAPDDQYSAIMLNGTPKERDFDRIGMFLGADGQGVIKVYGGGANRGGVELRAGQGPVSIPVYDSTQTAIADLARRP
ncbi:MAG: hypothetical protein MUE41_01895 [Gemmatimonadaceae bacterium]|nr:hypothetical protein [Gemmatimonadaceae bacterium]